MKERYPLEGLQKLRQVERQDQLARLGQLNRELELQRQRLQAAISAATLARDKLLEHQRVLHGWFERGPVSAQELSRHALFRRRPEMQLLRAREHERQVELHADTLEAKQRDLQEDLRETLASERSVVRHHARWQRDRATRAERVAEEESADTLSARSRARELPWR